MPSISLHRIAIKISSNNKVPDRAPDFIDDSEYEYWYLDNKQEVIRDNFGNIHWYRESDRHREDGPAVLYTDGSEEWWLNDQLVGDGFKPTNWDELVEEERVRQVMED